MTVRYGPGMTLLLFYPQRHPCSPHFDEKSSQTRFFVYRGGGANQSLSDNAGHYPGFQVSVEPRFLEEVSPALVPEGGESIL